ncbi:MAG TPA: HPr family phosphocarrier protein [Oligella sp.]|nr:HPr family phosphocarrier protein [Oligella sp.]
MDIVISNKLGLHARAAAKLTQLASTYESDIFISRAGQRVNAKSIMGVMMLAAGKGVTVVLDADGSDAAAALEAIQNLFDDKFGEDE